jgi:hypothetical protein
MGNDASIKPLEKMAAVLTRNGVQLIRQNDRQLMGEVALFDNLGSNTLDGNLVTGTKLQSMAWSNDLTRLYIAGQANGKNAVFVIDLVTLKLLDTIVTPAGKNIVSLATAGDLLLIGEGDDWGRSGGFRLLAMQTNPVSDKYHDPKSMLSIKGAGIEASLHGIAGMVVGPDGRTLVITLPKTSNTFWGLVPYRLRGPDGDVLVLDLNTLNLDTGTIDPPIVAEMTGVANGPGRITGLLRSPLTVSATHDANRYLVCSIASYDSGLDTLTLKRDANGRITGATMQAIEMRQSLDDLRIDRLNLQRAQSAVLVVVDGVEYAIVSDDLHPYEDTFVDAMLQTPDWVFNPFSMTMEPVGGDNRRVAAGGKLGVVKDPFGKLGVPEYLGATLPLDGYMIRNLTLSDYLNNDLPPTIIGQLFGLYSVNVRDLAPKPSENVAWNARDLIQAALDNKTQSALRPNGSPLNFHLKLPKPAEQHIPLDAAIAQPQITSLLSPYVRGTAFDDEELIGNYVGNMGDVLEIDLADVIADAEVRKANKWANDKALNDQEKKVYNEAKAKWVAENKPKDFSLQLGQLQTLSVSDRLKLLTARVSSTQSTALAYKVLSRTNDLLPAEFSATGRLYMMPVISPEDVTVLRNGGRIETKTEEIKNLSVNNIYGQRHLPERDDRRGKMVESEEAAFEFLIPHEQLAKAVEPAMRNLHNPPPGSLRRMLPFLFGFLSAPFNVGNIAVFFNDAQRRNAGIASIRAQVLAAPLCRFGAPYRDAIQNRCKLTDIMSVSSGHDDRQRDATTVHQQVSLAPIFSPDPSGSARQLAEPAAPSSLPRRYSAIARRCLQRRHTRPTRLSIGLRTRPLSATQDNACESRSRYRSVRPAALSTGNQCATRKQWPRTPAAHL